MAMNPEWRKILRKAKSARYMVIASVLTGCEAVISAVGVDWMPVPLWVRMLVILSVIGLAFAYRLIAQKGYTA